MRLYFFSLLFLLYDIAFAFNWVNGTTAGISTTPDGALKNTTAWKSRREAIARLLPANSWDHDASDLSHLMPTISNKLLYTESGRSGKSDIVDFAIFIDLLSILGGPSSGLFASLNASYVHPAVVLEHSGFIASVKCFANGLIIRFATLNSFKHAQSTWTTPQNGSLIITTHSHDCGDGDRTHWLASRFGFYAQNLTVAVYASQVAISSAFTDVHMNWGTPNPSTTPGNGSSPIDPYCGPLNASVIDGFPAAPCGDDFDTTLDDAIGYIPSNNASPNAILNGYVNGLSVSESLGQGDNSTMYKRSPMPLSRRQTTHVRRGLFSWAKDAVNSVVNFAKDAVDVAETVADVVTTAINVFVGTAEFVADVMEDGAYEGSINETSDLKLGPADKDLVDSPWGKAYPLFHLGDASGSLDIYCKDCGITGQVHLAGDLKFSISECVPGLKF